MLRTLTVGYQWGFGGWVEGEKPHGLRGSLFRLEGFLEKKCPDVVGKGGSGEDVWVPGASFGGFRAGLLKASGAVSPGTWLFVVINFLEPVGVRAVLLSPVLLVLAVPCGSHAPPTLCVHRKEERRAVLPPPTGVQLPIWNSRLEL